MKLGSKIISLKLYVLLALHEVFGQSTTCPCEDTSIQSTWGSVTSEGTCEGVCSGTRIDTRDCHYNINGVMEPTMQCQVTVPCDMPCPGSWMPWSTVDGCDITTCMETQVTYCSEKISHSSNLYQRSVNCRGSGGKDLLTKKIRCRITTNCVAVSTLPATTPPSDQTPAIDTTKFSDVGTLESNFNKMVLAVVIGSVALICIAMVAVILVCSAAKRKRRPRTDFPPYTSAVDSSFNTASVTMWKSDKYETVGPPLPDRPPPRAPACREQPQTVPNALYQPMQEDDDTTGSLEQTSDYLLPMPSSNSDIPDSEYFSIAENRQ